MGAVKPADDGRVDMMTCHRWMWTMKMGKANDELVMMTR